MYTESDVNEDMPASVRWDQGQYFYGLYALPDLSELILHGLVTPYGSGHEGAAVLLPGFAIKW